MNNSLEIVILFSQIVTRCLFLVGLLVVSYFGAGKVVVLRYIGALVNVLFFVVS